MTIVQKYGGTSVADPVRIKGVASRVAEYVKKGNRIVVVVSALGGTTDELISLASQITDEPSEREMDMLLSTGEQVSVALLAMALHKRGIEAISFTGAQVGIITDSSHTKAKIIDVNAARIRKALRNDKVAIVAGFQGVNLDQEITTLGRGGSDMTAVALAKVLKADMCQIYTDVKGVYTTDPRIVPSARKLESISYEEMLEMASLGARVMQARSMEVAHKFNIPMEIRSSMSREKGTLVIKEVREMEDVLVRGITLNRKEAKVTVCDVPDKPGEASRLFEILSKAHINVDMIIQNISRTGATDISFTVEEKALRNIKRMKDDICRKIGAKSLRYDRDVAKVSVVGIGMRSHSGVAARMFKTLASKKINIEMISTSEIKISVVVADRQAESAVKALHRVFGLAKKTNSGKKKRNKSGKTRGRK
jgi:aspartate kinase